MEEYRKEQQQNSNKAKWHGNHGPSSFFKLDSSLVFKEMKMKQGDTFVDLGCGAGDYSLYAAKIVGEQGKVYAIDVQTKLFEGINQKAQSLHIYNIKTIESDICQTIDIASNYADSCLLATVMHAQKTSKECKNLFLEITRILKPNGLLAVIECKKEIMSFGPPLEMRISPEELKEVLIGYGFHSQKYIDLGYYYMVIFKV